MNCKFGCIWLVLAVLLSCHYASASSVMAVGQDEGYSSKVMDKIITKWSPPAHLKKEYKLKLRISLDHSGKVVYCRPQRSSGLEALDASACAAVNAASPFGPPPYGMPADIYLSFWTGNPNNMIPAEPEQSAKFNAEAMSAEARANAANAKARAMAEQVAQSTGKQLPGQKQDISQTGKKAEDNHQIQPDAEKDATDKTQKETAKSDVSPILAQSKYSEKHEKYINGILKKLRNSIYIPVQTQPGTYYSTAQINLDKQGNITGASIIKGSGDDLLDKYVIQGIRRAKQVLSPPPELGNTVDLTFTLVR